MHTTPSHHHPVVVWMILGCSKLVHKLSIYMCVHVCSDECLCEMMDENSCLMPHALEGVFTLVALEGGSGGEGRPGRLPPRVAEGD